MKPSVVLEPSGKKVEARLGHILEIAHAAGVEMLHAVDEKRVANAE